MAFSTELPAAHPWEPDRPHQEPKNPRV